MVKKRAIVPLRTCTLSMPLPHLRLRLLQLIYLILNLSNQIVQNCRAQLLVFYKIGGEL